MAVTVSLIIPVHNGGENFARCLASVAATSPPPEQLIIVADGESDGSWRYAEDYPAEIIKLNTAGGPARARNRGAEKAREAILLFIDADITIQPNTVARVKRAFEDPAVSAIMGSYDDQPAGDNFLSQYRNLLHHYVHQNGETEASTFWAGCGAVRAGAFHEIGGFNEHLCRPSNGSCPGTIEDIELGYRLREAGHSIRLVKDLQVKHHKLWNWHSLLKTDFFYRALPWTRLIIKQDKMINDLNLRWQERTSVALVYLLLLSPLVTLTGLPGTPAPLILIALLLLINRRCYGFFIKKRGLGFTILVIPWHWLYFLYSGAAFICGTLSPRAGGEEH